MPGRLTVFDFRALWRRRGSAHVKHSVSHHMVIKPFFSTQPSCWRWVWSTVVQRLLDTHRRTKLTAPETISHSRDKV